MKKTKINPPAGGAKLPKDFKPLLWSYNFAKIDAEKHKKEIIINSINYGDWRHWQWLIKTYGRGEVKKTIINIPSTAFFSRPLTLISLLLGIKKMKYASRSDYIKAQENL